MFCVAVMLFDVTLNSHVRLWKVESCGFNFLEIDTSRDLRRYSDDYFGHLCMYAFFQRHTRE